MQESVASPRSLFFRYKACLQKLGELGPEPSPTHPTLPFPHYHRKVNGELPKVITAIPAAPGLMTDLCGLTKRILALTRMICVGDVLESGAGREQTEVESCAPVQETAGAQTLVEERCAPVQETAGAQTLVEERCALVQETAGAQTEEHHAQEQTGAKIVSTNEEQTVAPSGQTTADQSGCSSAG